MPPELVLGHDGTAVRHADSGTPIGLPGPPHIPLGVPAGLQKHVMKNHTFMESPEPGGQVKIHVKQKPGMTYPKPASHVKITEEVCYRHRRCTAIRCRRRCN